MLAHLPPNISDCGSLAQSGSLFALGCRASTQAVVLTGELPSPSVAARSLPGTAVAKVQLLKGGAVLALAGGSLFLLEPSQPPAELRLALTDIWSSGEFMVGVRQQSLLLVSFSFDPVGIFSVLEYNLADNANTSAWMVSDTRLKQLQPISL